MERVETAGSPANGAVLIFIKAGADASCAAFEQPAADRANRARAAA